MLLLLAMAKFFRFCWLDIGFSFLVCLVVVVRGASKVKLSFLHEFELLKVIAMCELSFSHSRKILIRLLIYGRRLRLASFGVNHHFTG